mmetsp:Transcript_25963/g.25217  ORF Transcript_25963/g.25217 Transcript_25963/m.25217 type:complete len:154 (-) Transcript_25963:268-729(-)
MDSLASLALASEPPNEDLMKKLPNKRNQGLLSRKMVKHILGMSIFQVAILCTILFAGEHFFPEPDPTWRFERAPLNNYIYPGHLYDWDGSPLYILKEEEYGPSRHMTNIFNIFVFFQIFNMVNAKKINDELNIFKGLCNNLIFLVVLVSIIAG